MNWPDSLPCISAVGYADALSDLTIRTDMDVGPAKVRRRATAGVRVFQTTLTMSEAQMGTFVSFYRDDLMEGVLRFEWTDPLTKSTAEMRFAQPPEWTKRAGYFIVNCAFEVLP